MAGGRNVDDSPSASLEKGERRHLERKKKEGTPISNINTKSRGRGRQPALSSSGGGIKEEKSGQFRQAEKKSGSPRRRYFLGTGCITGKKGGFKHLSKGNEESLIPRGQQSPKEKCAREKGEREQCRGVSLRLRRKDDARIVNQEKEHIAIRAKRKGGKKRRGNVAPSPGGNSSTGEGSCLLEKEFLAEKRGGVGVRCLSLPVKRGGGPSLYIQIRSIEGKEGKYKSGTS